MYPSDYLYSEEHEWIKVDGDVAVLGITDFAQKELGEVVYFEMPEVGESFAAGDEVGSIESVKAVSPVYTPVAGEVVEVNTAIDDSPEKVNDDPHGAGWLVKLRLSSSEELEKLMSAEQYEAFLKEAEEG
ncbi:MAG TPA: glycine cleavage system protein GcvH [Thermoanaerobaculia bacterium]|jgi:glycine cleavage system H protein